MSFTKQILFQQEELEEQLNKDAEEMLVEHPNEISFTTDLQQTSNDVPTLLQHSINIVPK